MSPAENKTLREMNVRLAHLETAICGNGTKGLAERVAEHEDWIKSRPQDCPLIERKKGAVARKAMEIGAIALVITIIELVLKVAGVT